MKVFKRKPRDPVAQWEAAPIRLGWSVLDMRLVEARVVRKKVLQLRFTDDGSFPYPAAPTRLDIDELGESERWVMAPTVVDVMSGGTRIATTISGFTGGLTLHVNHGLLIVWRIAQGQLQPDNDLLAVLGTVGALREALDRIDLDRVRREVPAGRVPTEGELEETQYEFTKRQNTLDGIGSLGESEEPLSDEMVGEVRGMIERMIETNPFALDGAPYLKEERA